MSYQQKYLKYKAKYLELKNQFGGLTPEEEIVKNIEDRRKKICPTDNKFSICVITDEDIINVSNFLVNYIPLCKQADITVENIKKGNILGQGTYGYSFLTKNDDNTNHRIIKINIYTDKSKPILEAEKDIHMALSKAQKKQRTNYFAELYGYFFHNNSTYTYTYLDEDSNEKIACEKTDIKGRELYTIMEAGIDDLLNILPSKSININIIINGFTNLLNFYKISYEFCDSNLIFKHSDIKLENLILMNDKETIKIIDFGLSEITPNFFTVLKNGTERFIHIAFGFNKLVISPLYDILCLIYSLFVYINNSYMVTHKFQDYTSIFNIINKNINTNKELDATTKMKLHQLNLLASHICMYNMIKFSNRVSLQISDLEKMIFDDFHTILKKVATQQGKLLPPCKDVTYPTDSTLSEGRKQMMYLEAIINSYLNFELPS